MEYPHFIPPNFCKLLLLRFFFLLLLLNQEGRNFQTKLGRWCSGRPLPPPDFSLHGGDTHCSCRLACVHGDRATTTHHQRRRRKVRGGGPLLPLQPKAPIKLGMRFSREAAGALQCGRALCAAVSTAWRFFISSFCADAQTHC